LAIGNQIAKSLDRQITKSTTRTLLRLARPGHEFSEDPKALVDLEASIPGARTALP